MACRLLSADLFSGPIMTEQFDQEWIAMKL